jgi:hypothetical protein
MIFMITTFLAAAAPQGDIVLKLFADRTEIGSGDTIGMRLVVTNLNVKHDLVVSQVRLTLPSSWHLENNEENVLSSPVTVARNSSKLVEFNITIPGKANTSSYSIFATISATRNATVYSETTFTEIAVERPPEAVERPPDSILRQIDWDTVWILFLVYAIPGIVIERVVEMIKLGWPDKRKQSADLKADRATIEKLKATDVTGLKSFNINNPAEFQKELTNLEEHASKEDWGVNIVTYSFSWAIALVPSFILMIYGIGLLQIAGINEPLAQAADVMIGSLIIAFVSKPTHDVIKIIESIRTVKK